MAAEMESRYSGLQTRFEALHEPLQIRRDNLYDSQQLHSFNREVADESFWIEEKLPLASSSQLGHSNSEVQALQQKHDLLEADIKTHEKVGLISSNEATLQIQRLYPLLSVRLLVWRFIGRRDLW